MEPDFATTGMVFYLFGISCALWAQNSNRNAWLWFFAGWLLAPFTAVVLLYKNSQDRQAGTLAGSTIE